MRKRLFFKSCQAAKMNTVQDRCTMDDEQNNFIFSSKDYSMLNSTFYLDGVVIR